jgi:hypothetical protein
VTSLDPLQISKDGLEALKDKYNIGPELWDLTLTFGNKPLIAAAGEGVMRIQEGDNGIRGRFLQQRSPSETDSLTDCQTSLIDSRFQ